MNKINIRRKEDTEIISGLFEISINTIVYRGKVKMSSGNPEIKPRKKASGRLLTAQALFTRRPAVFLEINNSVPLLFR